MRSFCVRADNVRSVVVNEGIIRSDPRGFGENRAVLRGVWGLRTNEADEVMHRSCFVVHDLEEEGRNDLPDSCEVGVERLPGDWLKLIERMRELCPKMAFLLSSGSGAAVFGVLHIHREITTYTE